MAGPSSRREFKEYILRRLGFPVIEINVDDTQVEDRIDDALSYYQEYHFDGMEQGYFSHQITQEDKDRKYITVPTKVIGITKLVDGGGISKSSSSLFDVSYQMMLNDFFNIASSSIVPYYMALRHINMFQEMFNATPGIRFNRKTDKVYIDTSWDKYSVGSYVVFECYSTIDPEEVPEVWSDKWLMRYATALVKRQWGGNMSKFQNIALLGGQMMNGAAIYAQAEEEIAKLEDEMIHSYSIPNMDFIGPGL